MEIATTKNKEQSEEATALRDELANWKAKDQQQRIEISTLKTELEVTDCVFEKLGVN